jgi:hypothetical protein
MSKYETVRGQAGNMVFLFLQDALASNGAGKTGLTNASSGLSIAVRRERSSAFTVYSGANIGNVATLGTWADPGAGKCNFREMDATNAAGMYELHLLDTPFGTGDTSRRLVGMVNMTNVAPCPFEISLTAFDVQTANTPANVLQIDGQEAVATSSVTFPANVGNSTYAGADTAGTTTLLTRVSSNIPNFPNNFSELAIEAGTGEVTATNGGGGGSGSFGYILPVGQDIPPSTVFLTAGANTPNLRYVLLDNDGDVVPYSDSDSVRIIVTAYGANTPNINTATGIYLTDPAGGVITFAWSVANVVVPPSGLYKLNFTINGMTYPIGSSIQLRTQ